LAGPGRLLPLWPPGPAQPTSPEELVGFRASVLRGLRFRGEYGVQRHKLPARSRGVRAGHKEASPAKKGQAGDAFFFRVLLRPLTVRGGDEPARSRGLPGVGAEVGHRS